MDLHFTIGGLGLKLGLSLSPLTVLFGANGCGKTTALEGIVKTLSLLRGDDSRGPIGDRYHPGDLLGGNVTVELKHLGVPDHPDERFFVQLLQFGRIWLSPRTHSGDLPEPLAWRIEGRDSYRIEMPSEPLASSEITELLVSDVLQALEDSADEWDEETRASWEIILRTCFASRWFWLRAPNGGAWLCPPIEEVDADVVAAAQILSALSADAGGADLLDLDMGRATDEDLTHIGEWIKACAAGSDEFGLHVASFGGRAIRSLELWDVVRVTDDDAAFNDVERRVGEFIERTLVPELLSMPEPGDESFRAAKFFDVDITPRRPDPWMQRRPDGWFRVHPEVSALCDRLSLEANRLAPEFVATQFEILVRPRAPEEWLVAAQRVEVALLRHESTEEFELASVGRGIAVWAAYSLIEAMRRLRLAEPILASGEERNDDWSVVSIAATALARDDTSNEVEFDKVEIEWEQNRTRRDVWKPIRPLDVQTLYVLDEPEKHLHPLAQEQVADWLVREVVGGPAMAVAATHAPAMLKIASPHASFTWLRRDADGLTGVVDVGEDLVDAVASHAHEMGFSPAEAVSLTRGWLVVEGEHDRAVVEHFFREELRQARVGVLVLRGAEEVKALLQLGHLSQLGRPLFVLLDDTKEAWVLAEQPPPGVPSREAKLIRELRHEWRDPNVDLELLSFPWPDIICALPPQAVVAMLDDLYPGKAGRFRGWEVLVAAHEQRNQGAKQPKGFKPFVFEVLGLPYDPDAFVRDVLSRVVPGSATDRALQRQVHRLTALVGQPRRTRVAPDLLGE